MNQLVDYTTAFQEPDGYARLITDDPAVDAVPELLWGEFSSLSWDHG